MTRIKSEPWTYKAENAATCPFCGSDSINVNHAEVRYMGQNEDGIKRHYMKSYCICNKCKARSTPVFYIGHTNCSGGFDDDFLPVYACGDKAIENWNNRQPVQQIIEKLEEIANTEKVVHGGRCNGKTLILGYNTGLAKAIEIIKEGLL